MIDDRVYKRIEVVTSVNANEVQMIASYPASGTKSGTGIGGGSGNELDMF